eukprot:15038537-Alexandrium_andersonii.AAC.1
MLACPPALLCGAVRRGTAQYVRARVPACLRACGAVRRGAVRYGACVRDCELNGAGSRVPCAFHIPCLSVPA